MTEHNSERKSYGAGIRVEDTKFQFKIFSRLIKKANPSLTLFYIGLLFLVLSSSIQVYVPKMASNLVNQFKTGIDIKTLIFVVGLFVLSAILAAIGGSILGIFGENVIKNLRQQVWQKLIILKIPYFDTVKSGELTSRITNDTSQVKQLLTVTFPQTIASIVTVIGTIYMMIIMDWHMSLAMIFVVPLVVIVIIPIMSFGTKVSHRRQDIMSRFTGIITETLSEIRLVKLSNAEKQAQKVANQEIDTLYQVGRKEAIFDATMQPLMMMLMMSMIFGLLAYGIHRIAIGEMAISTLMSFLMYLFNLVGALPIIGNLMTELAKAAGATRRVDELLKEDIEDFTSGQTLDLAGKVLDVDHINFAYEDKPEEKILKDISFEAKPNQIIAFAGPSGGGKSTIFSLIERFYQPQSGSISFENVKIQDIQLTNYRSQIGFVSQDSAILSGTIRYNLTYGLEEHFTDEQLWEVLELAYAKEFVKNMAKQLDTEVGERGTKISGGQRQRLAIARAFLRNPKILMLDEATASLDSESEMKVQKALEKLMVNRTTLVIAHRLSTIINSNCIYFIEKGEITGTGTHRQLLASHPIYSQYVTEQFKEF
ncbi:ABC transporter ATP-binding protein/permease [Streptococcus didelphis]|uniref:ABC transporter ATP-binding protein n=1 Tax=Streptococcus didelphis TaxID=102886 RepID=UPI00037F2F67|nr:ABC transporter ATP-binding protein [Streptococcus didelphis]WMB29396.1 ABC transporter ATP-binding protein/permease [Streptococcus didelphis]